MVSRRSACVSVLWQMLFDNDSSDPMRPSRKPFRGGGLTCKPIPQPLPPPPRENFPHRNPVLRGATKNSPQLQPQNPDLAGHHLTALEEVPPKWCRAATSNAVGVLQPPQTVVFAVFLALVGDSESLPTELTAAQVDCLISCLQCNELAVWIAVIQDNTRLRNAQSCRVELCRSARRHVQPLVC